MKGDLEAAVDGIIRKSLDAGAMPGCQILVAKDGQIVLDKCYGRLDRAGSSPAVDDSTIYDLASMSKVCGTLAALMKSYDLGLWQLDDEVGKFIPETKGKPVGSLTMRELLYHQSGLPAMLNVFRLVLDPDSYEGEPFKYSARDPYTVKIQDGVYGHKNARLRTDIFSDRKSENFPYEVAEGIYASDSVRRVIMDAIYDLTPKARGKYLYSDINFCLLMQIQENITGAPHDQWVEAAIYDPLGAFSTGYRPLEFYDREKIAPTEVDRFLRKQHVHGTVHDETAAFSGGVQGNAGLFSNVNELVRLFQTWLNGGVYGDQRIYSEETVRLFTETKSPTSDRGLGFDRLVSKQAWGISPKTYGHTGFTGTCFWIDPTENLIFIFLSNRVNPSRDNKAFTKMSPRNAVLKAVYDSLAD